METCWSSTAIEVSVNPCASFDSTILRRTNNYVDSAGEKAFEWHEAFLLGLCGSYSTKDVSASNHSVEEKTQDSDQAFGVKTQSTLGDTNNNSSAKPTVPSLVESEKNYDRKNMGNWNHLEEYSKEAGRSVLIKVMTTDANDDANDDTNAGVLDGGVVDRYVCLDSNNLDTSHSSTFDSTLFSNLDSTYNNTSLAPITENEPENTTLSSSFLSDFKPFQIEDEYSTSLKKNPSDNESQREETIATEMETDSAFEKQLLTQAVEGKSRKSEKQVLTEFVEEKSRKSEKNDQVLEQQSINSNESEIIKRMLEEQQSINSNESAIIKRMLEDEILQSMHNDVTVQQKSSSLHKKQKWDILRRKKKAVEESALTTTLDTSTDTEMRADSASFGSLSQSNKVANVSLEYYDDYHWKRKAQRKYRLKPPRNKRNQWSQWHIFPSVPRWGRRADGFQRVNDESLLRLAEICS